MFFHNILDRLLAAILVTQALSGCSNTASTHVPEGATQAGQPANKQQWLCAPANERQWQCVDLNDGSALKAIAIDHAVISEAVTASATSKDVSTDSAIVTDSNIADDTVSHLGNQPNNKLDSYPDSYLVAQLIAAHSQQTIDAYLQRHPQLPLQQLTTLRGDQQWHHLILGPYASYSDAQAAVASIDPPLTTAPWIRPLGPLKASLISSAP